MYDDLKEKMYKEEHISESVRFVHAEILKHDAPVQLCRLAAGEHQRVQQDTRDVTTADVIEMLIKECSKKFCASGGESSCQLNDNELFVQLESLGLVKESNMGKVPKNSKKTTDELLVCLFCYDWPNFHHSTEGPVSHKVPNAWFFCGCGGAEWTGTRI